MKTGATLRAQFRRLSTLYVRGKVSEAAVIKAAERLDHWQRCANSQCLLCNSVALGAEGKT